MDQEPEPPTELGRLRLRLRLRSDIREDLSAPAPAPATESEPEPEPEPGPEPGPEPDEMNAHLNLYLDMPALEPAAVDPRSPSDAPLAPRARAGRNYARPRRGLHNVTAEAMLQWMNTIAGRPMAPGDNQQGWRDRLFRSHAPYTSLASVAAGEVEEAVDHAFADLATNDSGAWPSRPSREQYRVLLDGGLVGQMVWYRTTFGGWPSDADFLAETLYGHMCQCYDGAYPLGLQVEALAHLIRMGQAVRCRLLPYLMMYHLQEGRWPTYDQWSAFLDRFLAFERDPVQFHQDDRMHTPVRGLDRLPVTAYASRGPADELQCAMCFDDLVPGQSVVVLPACGHTFHARGTDCIGTTVLEWFMKEHTCPTCRQEVVV